MRKILFLIFALWCFSLTSMGMGPFRNYIHRGWSSDEGLPQNSVYSIAQDKDGFIWIGTAEGLVKFDGAEFELFDKYSNSNFISNVILSLFENDDGCLWIGIKAGGIVRKCGEEFTHFSKDHGLTSDTVTAIVSDGKKILFGTFGGGVTVYENGKFKAFSKNSFLPDSFIYDMIYTNDTLYVATDDGLYAIKDDKVVKYAESEGLPELNIRALFMDSNDNLWVGTSDSGLAVLEKGSLKFKVFQTKDGISSDRIFGIQEDSSGKLWIGTIGGGVNIYDGKKFHHYTKKRRTFIGRCKDTFQRQSR